jgi:hypothetical protein
MTVRRLSEEEREERVLDLYYNQEMTYRDIAKLERMCPRDIGLIVNKESKDIESRQSLSKAAQAYRMFSEGKSPTDVAIALDLREPEVTKLYTESWKLAQIHDLNHLYREMKGNPAPLVKLYKLIKAAGLRAEDVVRIIKIANNDLPSIEYRYEALKVETDWLEKQKQSSLRILEDYDNQITALGKRLDSYCLSCLEEGVKLNNLRQKLMKREALVRLFESNNSEYIKIRETVEEQTRDMLDSSKGLLKYAVLSVTESIRNDPAKYMPLICGSTPSVMSYNIMKYSGSHMYGRGRQYLSIEDYSGMLVEEADMLYNKIVKDQTDQIIDDYRASTTTSKSSLPVILPSDEEQ